MFTATITPASLSDFQRALINTVELKGADPIKTLNKAGGLIASFAAAKGSNAKIPRADPARIEAQLRTVVAKSSRIATYKDVVGKNGKVRRKRYKLKRNKTQAASEWRGTLAAVIVARIAAKGESGGSKRYEKLIKKSLGGADWRKAAGTTKFFRTVGKFVKARVRSAGFHRSGLLPALKAFKARDVDSTLTRNFANPPGNVTTATRSGSRISARMEDSARAIAQIAPNAFKQAEREAAAMLEKWLTQDLLASAQTHGFKTRK